jgi:hypothetical protein
MKPRLADRLSRARRANIVGREAEKALFHSVLTGPTSSDLATSDPASSVVVFHVFGPGGIGKTTLLRAFRTMADALQIPVFHLDSRNIEPSPSAFTQALVGALGVETSAGIEQALGAQGRSVIFIDTFEQLVPLEAWLREVFFPQLPEGVMIVTAGRNPLAADWRLDPGWRPLLRQLSLRNLSTAEAEQYLTQRGVPPAEQPVVLSFTHGHPLALSLVADVYDQRPNIHFQPTDVPDVLKVLLEQFVQKAPGPAHRAALEACALVRVLTEGLLASILSIPDVHELFEWLRELSFIESTAQGIFPHDLARDALLAELRWRNPDWYTELHSRARAYYSSHLPQVAPLEQHRMLYDFIFLHRDNAMVHPFYEWQSGSTLPDRLVEADAPLLTTMVERHEGAISAQRLRYWIERQPESFLVFRDNDQLPVGFVLMLALDRVTDPDTRADPPVGEVLRYLQRQSPLRSGETGTFFRFWMAGDTYQTVSSIQSQIFVNMVRHYLVTPGLTHTFIYCADPDFWVPIFAYADLMRMQELDFSVDGRRYGIYGHDWRAVPPMAWLALMGQRELGTVPITPPQPAEHLIVLEMKEFGEAVHEALKHITRPLALRRSPLLRSRLVMDRVGLQTDAAGRTAELQTLLRAAVESLQASPKEARLYRVIYHTYIQPAATQELAAELLDLPFSTYRRHLKQAVARVAEILWQQEINGVESGVHRE